MPRRENGTATPLGATVRPQTTESRNGNGSGIRHDGLPLPLKPNPDDGKLRGERLECDQYGTFSRVRPKRYKKSPLPQRVCAYAECGESFAPKRPNQFYHSQNCRKFAHQHRLRDTGDAAARLVSALEAVSAAPDQPYQSHEQIWGKLLQLADRADSALKFWKSQIDHRSK
jgi:hypothetical protein